MTPIMNTTPVHFGAAGFHATQFYSRKSHAPSTLDKSSITYPSEFITDFHLYITEAPQNR